MGVVNFLDRGLIRFANYRAGKMSREWTACNEDGGEWRIGFCNQKQAEKKVMEGGKNQIIYLDNDLGFIFYK